MKKIFGTVAALMLLCSSSVGAAGIIINDSFAENSSVTAAEYSEYLEVYRETQVTDIVFSSELSNDVLNAAVEKASDMGISAWYSYEINTPEDLKAVVPPENGVGIEFDFNFSDDVYKQGGISKLRNEITTKIKELVGADISVKIPSDINVAYDSGFDVYEWSDGGLVDRIVVTPGENTANIDMSMDFWDRIIPDNIEKAATVGLNLNTLKTQNRATTLENASALANIYLTDGADKIYFDDFAYSDGATFEPLWETDARTKDAFNYLVRTLGDIETLKENGKRYIVANASLSGSFAKSQEYDILPINTVYRWQALRIKTGTVYENDRIVLLVGVSKNGGTPEADDIKVCMNTNHLTYSFEADDKYLYNGLYDGLAFAYEIDFDVMNKSDQIVEFMLNDYDVSINYIELRVMPRNDDLICVNMAEGVYADGADNRNILLATAGKELSYTVDVANKGIYALALCYKAEESVEISVNNQDYVLPEQSEYKSLGFACVSLEAGENTISIIPKGDINLNYMLLNKAQLWADNGQNELVSFQNGKINVNAKLSGLLKEQKLMLFGAVYDDDDELIQLCSEEFTVDTDNYEVTISMDVAESGINIKLFLWNNAIGIIPYADAKVY